MDFSVRQIARIALIGACFSWQGTAAASAQSDPGAISLAIAGPQQIPPGVQAIVVVEKIREASLLWLRGKAGFGLIAVNDGKGHWCEAFPMRLVSGDFGGDGVSVSAREPVLMFIYDRATAEALARGDDIVSDSVHVSHEGEPVRGDIEIRGGMSRDSGFVLNPGSSFLDDIFGAGVDLSHCSLPRPFGEP